jgi:8-oxo-dGTP pyrophosphatase MutT (NUDIX family)
MGRKKYYMVLPFVVARIERSGKILIGRQPDSPDKAYPLSWDLPGGKLKPLEPVIGCLLREVFEETGFTVDGYEWFKSYHNYGNDPKRSNPLPGLGICFIVTVFSGTFNPTEMEEMHWAAPKEIRKLDLTPWAACFLDDIL